MQILIKEDIEKARSPPKLWMLSPQEREHENNHLTG